MEEAKIAKQHSHSPYSKFRVGAALRCADGTIVRGCNIENASFGLTNCAERVAIQTAVARGQRAFTGLAIAGDSLGPCMPCGACRQVMVEFDIDCVYLEAQDGSIICYTLEDLLPKSFGPKAMNKE